MLRYYSMRKGQAHAVTGSFGGEEGNENAFEIGFRNSFAGIFHLNNSKRSVLLTLCKTPHLHNPFSSLIRDGFGGINFSGLDQWATLSLESVSSIIAVASKP